LIQSDSTLNLAILLLNLLDSHAVKRELHDITNDVGFLALLVIEMKHMNLIPDHSSRLKHKGDAVDISENQIVRTGEDRD
jgi:hypothetical protein